MSVLKKDLISVWVKTINFLDKHISKELWDNLLNTYSMSSYEEMWKSFDLCLCLFKKNI